MSFEVAKRRIQDTSFKPSTVMQLPLPKEGVYQALSLEFHGSIVTTYASGSPAAPAEATVDTLIPTIGLFVNGRLVKTVRPHMLHMQEILTWGQEGRRSSSAAASAATNDNPTVDGVFTFGTTGQTSTARENIRIPFAMELARVGKEKTWLNLNGVSSAECKFFGGPESGLDTTGAPVVYTLDTFVIEAYLEEVIGVNPLQKFADYQQVWSQETIAAQVTDKQFDLATGNLLAGLSLYIKNGASPSVAADLGITSIKILTGNKIIKSTDFVAEQNAMRQTFRCNDKRASNKARLDGYVFIPLMTNDRDLNTAFDASNLNALKLVVSSHASATYGLTLNIEQHIIVPPK